jgi:hypothetical protein
VVTECHAKIKFVFLRNDARMANALLLVAVPVGTVAVAIGAVAWAAGVVDDLWFGEQLRREGDLRMVRSSVDGAHYLVRNGQPAADLLARARAIAWQVLQRVRRDVQQQQRGRTTAINTTAAPAVPESLRSGLQRLLRTVRAPQDIRVAELRESDDNLIALNRNKGANILLCLVDGAGEASSTTTPVPSLVSADVVAFVLLHELAHTATMGYDPLVDGRTQHSDEFFRYEHYLYEVASSMGLMRPQAINGAGVCGTHIRHPHPETLPAAAK